MDHASRATVPQRAPDRQLRRVTTMSTRHQRGSCEVPVARRTWSTCVAGHEPGSSPRLGWDFESFTRPREAPTVGDLSALQQFHFAAEVDWAERLLSNAIVQMRQETMADDRFEPVGATLALGIEKLYKLCIGLADLRETGSWSSLGKMKSYYHRVERMHDEVVTYLGHVGSDDELVAPLLAKVVENPAVPEIMTALGEYAAGGRFHYLDSLANAPSERPDPRSFWEQALMTLRENSGLQDELVKTATHNLSNDNAWEAIIHGNNELVVDALRDIVALVTTAGNRRVLGPMGVHLATPFTQKESWSLR